MKSICLLLILYCIFPINSYAQDSTYVDTQEPSFCWSFCTNAFIEAEALKNGKSKINLSEVYLISKVLEEKAVNYLRMKGNLQYDSGGNIADGIRLYQAYGTQKQSEQPSQLSQLAKLPELSAALTGMLDGLIKFQGSKQKSNWKTAVQQILNAYLNHGTDIEAAKSFADENVGINPDDYMQMTSWTHLPYYEQSILQMPDNWALEKSYNFPLDEFISNIDSALAHGYTLLWSGDISEIFFSLEEGIAYVPNKEESEMTALEKEELFIAPLPEKSIQAEDRQIAFDNFLTQSDFIMQIVGKVDDQNSRNWYLFKNACEIDEEDVFLYVSEDYLRFKTVSVLMNKNALPEDSRAKLK